MQISGAVNADVIRLICGRFALVDEPSNARQLLHGESP